MQEALLDHQDIPNGPETSEQTVPETSLPIDDNGLIDMVPVEDKIKEYIVLMARGDLDTAETLGREIASGGQTSRQVVEEMVMQEFLQPELAEIPPTVISGFFKRLLAMFG